MAIHFRHAASKKHHLQKIPCNILRSYADTISANAGAFSPADTFAGKCTADTQEMCLSNTKEAEV